MSRARTSKPPNVVFVFADQWRAQAVGYAGDPNVRTPHLDALAGESVNFTTAVAPCPVCSPYRASLLTGQHALTHGVIINDVHLGDGAVSIAQAFAAGGYDTGYIGKWHLNGRGRTRFIPRRDRQGFDFWRVCECTHQYNHSVYYGDENTRRLWGGYDVEAQTRAAQDYIRGEGRDCDKPFLLALSWGPPHDPYHAAPAEFGAWYSPRKLQLRPNVPRGWKGRARKELAGYYAHCSAMDDCIGRLRATLRQAGLEENTLFVFTSDHGDMLGSQGQRRKQRPWDESIRVPFLLHGPALFGRRARRVTAPFTCTDVMPTLLGLCGLPIPPTAEGVDFSGHLTGKATAGVDAALIACYWPFAEWKLSGGRAYRGVRTERHTYVRDLKGPWLLYDNRADPYQTDNLVNRPEHAKLQARLDATLERLLARQKDPFLPGPEYLKKWGYEVGPDGAAPYTD